MNQPMPLKDMPKYLEQARENPDMPAPVVGMGTIIVPEPEEKPSFWSGINKTGVAILASFLLCLGLVAYDASSVDHMTIIVDTSTPSQVIPQAVKESGGEITSVKQLDGSTYEVRVKTREEKKSFLERLAMRMNIRGYRD